MSWISECIRTPMPYCLRSLPSFSGAIGGAISRTATAPLETIRLRLIVGSSGPSSNVFLSTFRKIVSEDGPRGLFKGNLTNVVRSAPAKGIDFFAFEIYKSAFASLSSWLNIPDSAQKILAGSLAGGTSTTLLYPLDVVRTRVTSGAIQPTSGGLVGIYQASFFHLSHVCLNLAKVTRCCTFQSLLR